MAGCGSGANWSLKRLCVYQLCGFNVVWFLLLFPGSLGDSSEADAAVGLSQKSLFTMFGIGLLGTLRG